MTLGFHLWDGSVRSARLCLPQREIYLSTTDCNTQHLVVDNPSRVYMTAALAHLKHGVPFAPICPGTTQLKV